MKKKPIVILASILAIIVLVLVFTQSLKTTFNPEKTNFSFSKFEGIDKIIIQSPTATIELLKQDNSWKTNTGETADKSKVNTLLGAIKNLQMQSPVSKNQVQALRDSLAGHATTITLKNGHKKAYSLNFLNIRHRTVASKPNGKPFYIEIKGYSHVGFSELVYTEPEKWQGKLLFDFPKEEIKAVTVAYPLKEKEGFEIVNKNGSASLLDLNGSEISTASTQAISDYLHFFRGIKYEAANFSTPDSKVGPPKFSLLISAVKRDVYIQAYKLRHPASGQTDQTQFVGIINKADTVLLQYSDFDPIVVGIDFF